MSIDVPGVGPVRVPKYYQVKREILAMIADLVPGTAVPTERELAVRFGTSRTTVRQAIAVIIGVFALGVGAVWLRHSWPSQQFSAISVTLGAIPMSAACLIMTDPVLGLLATSA